MGFRRPISPCTRRISAFVSLAFAKSPASVHVVTMTRYCINFCHEGNTNWPSCKLQYPSRRLSGTSAIVLVGFCSRSICSSFRLLARRMAIVSAAEFDGAQTRIADLRCDRLICKTASTKVFVFPMRPNSGYERPFQHCLNYLPVPAGPNSK